MKTKNIVAESKRTTNKRQSNFELLRIILIIMILVLHYLNADMGGALSTKNIPNTHFNYYLARALESLCIVAVNCFILITGFFMYKRNSVKIGKVLNLIFTFIFYNILVYGVSIAFHITEFNKESLIQFGNTFIQDGGWFVIIYSILYLLIPYINIVIKRIDEKQFKILLLILIVAFSIWPTLLSNITVKDSGYGIIQFIMMYLIGAYIAKYKKNQKNIFIYIGIYLLMAIVTCLNSVKNIYIGTFSYNSIFNVIGSVSLFLVFSKIKFNSKWIDSIAKHTLGIYIIHVNSFVMKYIWQDIFHANNFYTRRLFIINLGISVITTFLICLVIDMIREKLFKYTIDKAVKNSKVYNYEIIIENEEKFYIEDRNEKKVNKKLATTDN